MFECSYVATIDFETGFIGFDEYPPLYKGFEALYNLAEKLFDGFTHDFRFFLYQCGTGYTYEGDNTIPY